MPTAGEGVPTELRSPISPYMSLCVLAYISLYLRAGGGVLAAPGQGRLGAHAVLRQHLPLRMPLLLVSIYELPRVRIRVRAQDILIVTHVGIVPAATSS